MAEINNTSGQRNRVSLADFPLDACESTSGGHETGYSTGDADPALVEGAVKHSPIGPVNMAAHRESQIDAIIASLAGARQPLPRPFSKRDLYRTAACKGVAVWKPTTKLEIRNRVLERLNYKWDCDLELFVPVIADDVVAEIETAAETITPALQDQDDLPTNLQSRLDDWCNEHGFDRLTDPEPVIARYALYYCLLKTTVYEQHHRRGTLPELPAELQQAFQIAREKTDNPAYDEHVLDEIALYADDSALDVVVEQRYRLLMSEQPSEDLGRLFEALTPKESRQKLGQFRTPPEIGAMMRRWATTDNARILDPGMGACPLSAPGFTSWVSSADPAHVDGIDRSHLSTVLGAAVMSIHGQPYEFREGDFLDLSPTDVNGDVDAVVCNPPYTRAADLSPEYREKINRLANEERNLGLSGNTPLYAYFIAHAAQFLSAGDRAAFITPNFLDRGYGEPLKQHLLTEFDIKGVVLFNPEEVSVFDEAETTALLTFLERRQEDADCGATRFIRVDDMPEMSELRRAVTGEMEDDVEWGLMTTIDQTELDPEQNWRGLFDPSNIDTSQLTPLSEIAQVKRGILTGKTAVFCVGDAEVREWQLSNSHLARIIRNASSVPHFDFRAKDWNRQRDDDGECWVLYHLDDITMPDKALDYATAATTDPSENALGSDQVTNDDKQNLLTYLEHGLSDSVSPPNRTFESGEDSWEVVERRDPPPVLVTSANRDRCRFILNKTGARNLNNLYGVYFDVDLTEDEMKALLAYLNSDVASELLRKHEQLRTDGMRKLEPGNAENLPVLDPRELPDETVAALADAFESLCDTARSGEELTPIIANIDEIVKQHL